MKLEITTGNAKITLTMPDGSVAFEQSYTDYHMVLDLNTILNNTPTIVEMIGQAMATIENFDVDQFVKTHTEGNVVFGAFPEEA